MSELVSLVGTLLAATILAVVHLLAGRVHSIGVLPGRVWLSAGGGAAVAYVFVHLLPELGEAHRIVGEPAMIGGILERHIYLVALAGFVLFYGLEHWYGEVPHAKRRRSMRGYSGYISVRSGCTMR